MTAFTGSENSGSRRPPTDFSGYNLIGRSSAFLSTLKKVEQIASLDVAVTIFGETGTGKELIARAIHYSGTWSGGPFIPVNCGALPDTLFENEMFGHERGAFTGASKSQIGLIAQAENGTLFLDEIEALTPKAQVALLRFLQDKTYRPLGSTISKSANVRIVAASNESFNTLMSEQGFRSDLYYRLNLIPLKIPPLRQRGEDILLLAHHFQRVFQHQYKQPNKHLTAATLTTIQNHPWPGNVRELESSLHRAFLLSESDAIAPTDLFDENTHSIPNAAESEDILKLSFKEAKSKTINNFEQRYLHLLMKQFNGNISAAAKHSGKERSALSRLIKKHDSLQNVL